MRKREEKKKETKIDAGADIFADEYHKQYIPGVTFLYCNPKITACPHTDCARYHTKAPYNELSFFTSQWDLDDNGNCEGYLPENEFLYGEKEKDDDLS